MRKILSNILPNIRFTPAVLVLIAMNIIPLIGVFKFGWDAGTIIFLYWLENIVIGLLNIIKILSAHGSNIPNLRTSKGRAPSEAMGSRIFLCFFFAAHYGLFCLGHYSFLRTMYQDLPDSSGMISALMAPVLFWSLLGLICSHVISMLINFYGRGEYKKQSPKGQMFAPYTRIAILHVVIILSGGFAMAAGEGVVPLVILVIFKIGFDLAAHLAEHAWLAVDKEELV